MVSSWFYSEQKAKREGFLDKNKYNYFVSFCALDNFAVKFVLFLKMLGSLAETIEWVVCSQALPNCHSYETVKLCRNK